MMTVLNFPSSLALNFNYMVDRKCPNSVKFESHKEKSIATEIKPPYCEKKFNLPMLKNLINFCDF